MIYTVSTVAVYKVPQDVEAEDKLIGPFSFRQFIYLIVAALGIFMSWALSRIFIGLLILPLPIVIAFLALALPLRKDQPMETYLIAMIKFFFKPRNRLWDPEGTISMIRITAATSTEGPRLKGFNGDEASQRLAYLAQVVDTQGWSTRGAVSANDSMSDIFVAEASHAEDILDENSGTAQYLGQRIAQADDARMQAARAQMQQALAEVRPLTPPVQPATHVAPASAGETPVATFNPYPSLMKQHVVEPDYKPATPPTDNTASSSQAQAEKQPGATTVSPDIMNLANNNDLSISALSREARRLEDDDNEVVISLR